jgi:hypothetical protein
MKTFENLKNNQTYQDLIWSRYIGTQVFQISTILRLEESETYKKLAETEKFESSANKRVEILAFLLTYTTCDENDREEYAKKALSSNDQALAELPEDLDKLSNFGNQDGKGSINWGALWDTTPGLEDNVNNAAKANYEKFKREAVDQSVKLQTLPSEQQQALRQITTLDKLKANQTYQKLADQKVFTALVGDDKQLAIIEFLLNYVFVPDTSRETFIKLKLSKKTGLSLDALPAGCSKDALDTLANVAGDLNKESINWEQLLKDPGLGSGQIKLPKLENGSNAIKDAISTITKKVHSERFGVTGAKRGALVSSAIVLPITAVMAHYNYLLPGFAGLGPLPVTLIALVGAVALSSIIGGLIGNRCFEYKKAVGINEATPAASSFVDRTANFKRPNITYIEDESDQVTLSFNGSFNG